VDYESVSPWFIEYAASANVRQVCARLGLRACAELAAGQSDMALEDLKLIFYLVDSFKASFFGGQWSRIHILEQALQPIWEGLAEHTWSQPQLQELTTRLQRFDFLTDCRLYLDAQRAVALWTIDSIPKTEFSGWFDQGSTLAQLTRWPDWICRILPTGWFGWEKLGYCRLFEIYLRSGFDPPRKRLSPSDLETNAVEADRLYDQQYDPQDYNHRGLRAVLSHKFFAGSLFQPHLHRFIRGFAVAQAVTDQAILACALEQYRLAHGQFPDKLEALTPQFISQLPKDALTGEPYKHRRADDGQFVLYSVGWNEKDDGGTVALSKDGSVDVRNGDWVWEYPAK